MRDRKLDQTKSKVLYEKKSAEATESEKLKKEKVARALYWRTILKIMSTVLTTLLVVSILVKIYSGESWSTNILNIISFILNELVKA